jgi:hypothetical protein
MARMPRWFLSYHSSDKALAERFPPRGVTLSTTLQPCYICFHPVPWRSRTRAHAAPTPEVPTMSTAPLSARLLAVVASAAIVVIMLGTGGLPAHSAYVSLTCPSKSLLHHYSPWLRLTQQRDNKQCCECFDPAYHKCVTDLNCAELRTDPRRDQDMIMCYTICDNRAKTNCNCLCIH